MKHQTHFLSSKPDPRRRATHTFVSVFTLPVFLRLLSRVRQSSRSAGLDPPTFRLSGFPTWEAARAAGEPQSCGSHCTPTGARRVRERFESPRPGPGPGPFRPPSSRSALPPLPRRSPPQSRLRRPRRCCGPSPSPPARYTDDPGDTDDDSSRRPLSPPPAA